MNEEPELPENIEAAVRRMRDRAAADIDVEAALKRVKPRLGEPNVYEFPVQMSIPERIRAGWRRTSMGAAAVVLLAAGAWWWQATRSDPATVPTFAAQQHETGVGETRTLDLPDGTRVVLGPASRIGIGAEYGGDARVVMLAGEALFDVVHDDARPFSVRAGSATIRDIGTTFTVRTAATGIEVAVTAGSVVLHATARPEQEGVVLRAGDLGELDAIGRATKLAGRVTDADTAFTSGRLVLEETTLENAALALKRWYGITLVAEPDLTQRHITASFRNEPVQEVLDIIGLALGARIELRGDTAVVRAQR